jgi:hypothetical protein
MELDLVASPELLSGTLIFISRMLAIDYEMVVGGSTYT